MPFASAAIFKACFERILAINADAVIPMSGNNHFEPLHAIYRCEPCKKAVFDAIQCNQHRLISWLEKVNTEFLEPEVCSRLDPSGLAFYNLNTQADLDQALTCINVEQNKCNNRKQPLTS
jgi:molybdopterin-guanine dinucleotide biosynthesis protein A